MYVGVSGIPGRRLRTLRSEYGMMISSAISDHVSFGVSYTGAVPAVIVYGVANSSCGVPGVYVRCRRGVYGMCTAGGACCDSSRYSDTMLSRCDTSTPSFGSKSIM